MADNMPGLAKKKLRKYNNIDYIIEDFYDLKPGQKYDAALSCLALHHLITDKDKIKFYKKIYHSLTPGGVFYIADVIPGSNDTIQEMYMDKWKEYMSKHLSKDVIKGVLENYYAEDRPGRLFDHIKWLEQAGFSDADIIWKNYNGAVFKGMKK